MNKPMIITILVALGFFLFLNAEALNADNAWALIPFPLFVATLGYITWLSITQED